MGKALMHLLRARGRLRLGRKFRKPFLGKIFERRPDAPASAYMLAFPRLARLRSEMGCVKRDLSDFVFRVLYGDTC